MAKKTVNGFLNPKPYTITELKKLRNFVLDEVPFDKTRKNGLIVGRPLLVRTQAGAKLISENSINRQVNRLLATVPGPPVRLGAVCEELDELDEVILSQRVLKENGEPCVREVSARLRVTAEALGYAPVVQWCEGGLQNNLLHEIVAIDKDGQTVAVLALLDTTE